MAVFGENVYLHKAIPNTPESPVQESMWLLYNILRDPNILSTRLMKKI